MSIFPKKEIKKSHSIAFKKSEWDHIKKIAAKKHLTPAAFIRQIIFNSKIYQSTK